MMLKKWVQHCIEALKDKWEDETYFFDEAEAEKIFKFIGKLRNDKGTSSRF